MTIQHDSNLLAKGIGFCDASNNVFYGDPTKDIIKELPRERISIGTLSETCFDAKWHEDKTDSEKSYLSLTAYHIECTGKVNYKDKFRDQIKAGTVSGFTLAPGFSVDSTNIGPNQTVDAAEELRFYPKAKKFICLGQVNINGTDVVYRRPLQEFNFVWPATWEYKEITMPDGTDAFQWTLPYSYCKKYYIGSEACPIINSEDEILDAAMKVSSEASKSGINGFEKHACYSSNILFNDRIERNEPFDNQEMINFLTEIAGIKDMSDDVYEAYKIEYNSKHTGHPITVAKDQFKIRRWDEFTTSMRMTEKKAKNAMTKKKGAEMYEAALKQYVDAATTPTTTRTVVGTRTPEDEIVFLTYTGKHSDGSHYPSKKESGAIFVYDTKTGKSKVFTQERGGKYTESKAIEKFLYYYETKADDIKKGLKNDDLILGGVSDKAELFKGTLVEEVLDKFSDEGHLIGITGKHSYYRTAEDMGTIADSGYATVDELFRRNDNTHFVEEYFKAFLACIKYPNTVKALMDNNLLNLLELFIREVPAFAVGEGNNAWETTRFAHSDSRKSKNDMYIAIDEKETDVEKIFGMQLSKLKIADRLLEKQVMSEATAKQERMYYTPLFPIKGLGGKINGKPIDEVSDDEYLNFTLKMSTDKEYRKFLDDCGFTGGTQYAYYNYGIKDMAATPFSSDVDKRWALLDAVNQALEAGAFYGNKDQMSEFINSSKNAVKELTETVVKDDVDNKGAELAYDWSKMMFYINALGGKWSKNLACPKTVNWEEWSLTENEETRAARRPIYGDPEGALSLPDALKKELVRVQMNCGRKRACTKLEEEELQKKFMKSGEMYNWIEPCSVKARAGDVAAIGLTTMQQLYCEALRLGISPSYLIGESYE